MAVRDDFAAGEVLAAADLNDTFASKAPTASPTFTGTIAISGATLNVTQAEIATLQSTSSATYADLATAGPAVTLTTGTKALVIVSARTFGSGVATETFMGWEVSGATTLAANDKWALVGFASSWTAGTSRAYLITGLTAGSNTFTAKYKRGGSAVDAFFENRQIAVIDMGS